jgi:sporulation protein YlmC with PRC-barrel domain
MKNEIGKRIASERQPMTQTIEYDIGSEVACSDGACGELRRVVIDPVAKAITDLVVEPKHRRGTGRLVPIDLVASVAEQIHLQCTTAEFEGLDEAEETQFLPGATGAWGYDQEHMMSMPYYGMAVGGLGGMGLGGMSGLGVAGMGGMGPGPQSIIADRVPTGDVEVRRGDPVQATDGDIGKVQGLVINPADHHVTHVLLDEGHLWGKKRVAIPITAVRKIALEVQVSLTKDEVRDLPEVDLDDHE